MANLVNHMRILLLSILLGLSAIAAERPNILVVVADDWSFPHAGAYGCKWINTPSFDKLAEEGLKFTRAYTPVAKCSASRAAILTGRNPWTIDSGFVHYNFFPAHFPSYAEALGKHGYFTGYTGKGWSPGIAKDTNGKNRQLLGKNFAGKSAKPPANGIASIDYAANFADFLAANDDSKPWLFWFGCQEPHRAYEFQSGVKKGGKKLSDIDKVPGYWPDTPEVRHDMLDYAMEVEHFDLHLGRIVDQLRKSNQLENTLIIVTGDNGMPFPRAKGQTYEIASHLPFAVHWPAGIKKGGLVIDDYISFIDLAPTILEAAGLEPKDSGMEPFTGRSLLPLFKAGKSGQVDPTRDHVLLGRERHDPGRPNNQGYPIRAIVSGDFLYLHNFAPDRWPASNPETGYLDVDASPTKSRILSDRRENGSDPFWSFCFGKRDQQELYDLSKDQDCIKNLASNPEYASKMDDLEKRLLNQLIKQKDPRLLGKPDYFDEFIYSKKEMNDLYERWKAGDAKLPSWVADTDAEPEPLD